MLRKFNIFIMLNSNTTGTILAKEFSEEKVRYALIGGFAMGALGIVRSTGSRFSY